MSTPESVSTPRVGKHAIVYGGSMAGLITSGVLARHFERVTLVERDRLEQGPRPRKGVPQAWHIHGLLTRGMDVLCDVFPGFREDLKATGAVFLDMAGEHAWYMAGLWRPRIDCGVTFYSQSRPLLEWAVRERLLALANVHLLDGHEVTGFQMNADNTRVTGLHLQATGGGRDEPLEGEWVVDSSGRGSRTPQWLEALGYPRVEETHIHVDVGYATQLFQFPQGFAPGWKMLSISPELPRTRRIGAMVKIEEERWLVSQGGWLGEHAPTDNAGFLESTRGLLQPHLHEVLRSAEPLGPVHFYRFSHNQRRHYERMARFPEGLAVVGDAFCSFNPIYGQGMTTAALQAEALGECLRQGLDGLASRYRRRVGRLLEVPWALSTSGDLRFPEVEGKRPPGFGLMNWYGDRFQRLAGQDEEALRLLVRVMHMLESPAALFSPRMMRKVLTLQPDAASLDRKPEPPATSPSRAT